MRKSILTAIILAAALVQSPMAAQMPVVDAKKTVRLFNCIGKHVAVRGVLVSVAISEADQIRFLDFTTDRERGFVAAIFPAVYKATGDLKKYKRQRVEVQGILEDYKTITQSKVTKAPQLTLLPKK